MGQDKALLDWHGQPLLDHMVGLMQTVAHPVRVVGRSPLPDQIPGLGPLSGIATALEATFTDANLIVAVDIPLLTEEFLNFLRSRTENSSEPLVACVIASSYPLCLGVWRPMLPEIKSRLRARELSVRSLIEGGGTEIISEREITGRGFDLRMFQNINTEEDYLSALRFEM